MSSYSSSGAWGMGKDLNVPRKWAECPRDPEQRPRWQSLYVTLKPTGEIILSRQTHLAMGEPAGYVLLYEAERETIGLKPGDPERNPAAYPAQLRGPYGGRRIWANRLIREFSIYVAHTVRFPRAAINHQGILILNLMDTVEAVKKRRRS